MATPHTLQDLDKGILSVLGAENGSCNRKVLNTKSPAEVITRLNCKSKGYV